MQMKIDGSGLTTPEVLRQRILLLQFGQIFRRQWPLIGVLLLLIVCLPVLQLPSASGDRISLILAWVVTSMGAVILCTILGQYVRRNLSRMSLHLVDWTLLLQCLLMGAVVGTAVLLTHSQFVPLQGASTFLILFLLVHLVGLSVLSDRLPGFVVFFFFSILPVLTSLPVDPRPLSDRWIELTYVLVILSAAAYVHRLRNQFIWLTIRNEDLLSHSDSQREFAEAARIKLEHEMSDRLAIEEELQQTNALLEQKVEERTADIQNMNAHLSLSRQNLEIAHKAAGIASWDWDIQHRQIECSNFESILGYDTQEMNQWIQDMSKLVHPEDYPGARQALFEHLRGRADRYEARFRIRHKTGHWLWVHDMGRVIERDPATHTPLRMVGIRRDIHDEVESEERLRLSASVFEQAAEGIFILNNRLDFVDCNPRLQDITGYTKTDLVGRHISAIANPSNPMIHSEYTEMMRQLADKGEYENEMSDRHKNGTPITLAVHINAIKNTQGQVTHYIGIVSDLTERRQNEQKLSYLANYDALTTLPNRHMFRSQLHQMIVEAAQSQGNFALIRLDIDRFGLINDSLGTELADVLLKQVAQRLHRVNRDASLIARLGSDDFAILLDMVPGSAGEREVQYYCESMIQAFEEPFVLAEQEVLATLSAGVAVFPDHGRQLNILLNHAEKALHEAKRRGGSTQLFFSEDHSIQSIERINLENSLRKALASDELVIYYQPKIHLATGQFSGFEALVRWLHPRNGLMSPALFIPIAEESGLISALGEQVLDRVCAQLRQWLDRGIQPARVSVNVVAQQFQRGNFLDVLDRIMAKHHIEGGLLELEITESSLLERPDRINAMLAQIRERGIQISLDDFGTGYSSLSYLQQFPIDVIKIDRSFISEVGQSPRHEAIVRAILAMGHTLGMQVVAEGVENQDQAQFLKREHCDYLQGFLISPPVPAVQAERFMQEDTASPHSLLN